MKDICETHGHKIKFVVMTLLLIVIAIGVFKIGWHEREFSKDGSANTLNVAGSSVITVSPNKAEISIQVLTQKPTALETQTENRQISDKVMTALKGLGLKDSDIETSGYNLEKDMVWEKESYIQKGYKLDNTVKVTTKDLTLVGKIVDSAVGAGANGVNSISFGLTREKEAEVKAEALNQAAVVAKGKATSMANALSVKLSGLNQVSESNAYYEPRYVNYAMAEKSMGAADAVAPTQINPQTLEVSAQVSLVYNIYDKEGKDKW